MRNRIDITNQRFERLIAQSPAPYYKKGYWECICDCGNVCYADGTKLRKGQTKSCGCYRKEFASKIGKSNKIEFYDINWTDKDFSYLLGVLHGDGHIRKDKTKKNPSQIHVSIGKKDVQYANYLYDLLSSKKLNPKLSEGKNGLNLTVNSVDIAIQFYSYKKESKWNYPKYFSISDYLAGVVDTDGTVNLSSHQISISQKSNGNLALLLPLFKKIELNPYFNTYKTNYKNNPYYVDFLTISDANSILLFAEKIHLRHYRKIEILSDLKEWALNVVKLQAIPSIENLIIDMLKKGQFTGDEIRQNLSLNNNQFYNAVKRLRENGCKINTIKKSKIKSSYYCLCD